MRQILRGHRPDITPAQFVAAVFAAVGPITALVGVHLSHIQQGAVGDLKVVALGLIGGDALIRVGRNHADAKRDAAAITASQPAAPAPPSGAPTTGADAISGSGFGGAVTRGKLDPERDITAPLVDETHDLEAEAQELDQALELGDLPTGVPEDIETPTDPAVVQPVPAEDEEE